MSWMEIFCWFLAFSAVSGLFYRKGIKAGIRHSLMTLDLDTHQIEKMVLWVKLYGSVSHAMVQG